MARTTTQRPRSLHRRLKRTACVGFGMIVLMCVSMIAVSVAKRHVIVERQGASNLRNVVVGQGSVQFGRFYAPAGPSDQGWSIEWGHQEASAWQLYWRPTFVRRKQWIALTVPLSMLALPSAAGSFLLWRSLRRDRLRSAEKPCPKCGYSLVGLADGALCPECGKAATSVARPADGSRGEEPRR